MSVTVAQEIVLSESTLAAIRALLKYFPLANVYVVAMTVIKSIGDDEISRVYEARVKTLGAAVLESGKLETCLVTVSKWRNSWRMTKINLGSRGSFTLDEGMDSTNGLKLDHEVDVTKAAALEGLMQTLPEICRRVMFDEITTTCVGLNHHHYEVQLPIRNTSLPQVPIDVVSVSLNRSFDAVRVECLVHRVGGTFILDEKEGWKRVN